LPERAERSEATDVKADGRVVIGGVPRSKNDVVFESTSSSGEKVVVTKRQGFAPPVDPEANESVAQLVTQLESRDTPSAFSSFAPPAPFDLKSYQDDPKTYLAKIEPGRVFAPAQPADDVPVIRAEGKRFHRLKQGESVRLRVAAAGGVPVAFGSQDLGSFENKLSSITVAADEKGIAEATFTATGGTIDLVQVLAASPTASGQVQFTIDVIVPD
jgi:hypothetical protein